MCYIFMKKLVYNKDTEELELIEIDQKRRVKSFLERNKIFFETVVIAFLTVMSIIVSVVGVRIDIRNQEISKKELEILENDREPYFKIECDLNYDEFESADNYVIKKTYTITNTGGTISGAYMTVCSYLEIYLPKDKPGEYDIYTYILPENFKNETLFHGYNEESKSFTFCEYESSDYNDYIKELEKDLRTFFDNESIALLCKNYADIVYVNYKNERYDVRYNFLENELILQDKQETHTFLGFLYEGDESEIVVKQIKDIIGEMNE